MKKDRQQLLEHLVSTMGDLQRCFAIPRDTFLAQFHLSRLQFEVLITLKCEPRTISSLAKRFGVTSSAISQLVDQLVRKELLERIEDPQDRRRTLVQWAEKSTVAFKDFRLRLVEHLEKRFSGITESELQNLLTILATTVGQLNQTT